MEACDPRVAEMQAVLRRMLPVYETLKDGSVLKLELAPPESAEIVHTVTKLAFAEFRGVLDPPNGSDSETTADVAEQIRRGAALCGSIGSTFMASARLSLNPDHLYVGRVGVAPPFRGRGAGGVLMRYIEVLAGVLGYTEIRLGTREKLTDNVAFYQKLGYEIVKTVQHPRGSDTVVLFTKRITVTG